jgi:hypothetical protein
MTVSKNLFIGTLIFFFIELLLLGYFNWYWIQCPPCPDNIGCPICLSIEQKLAIAGGVFFFIIYTVWIIYKKLQKPPHSH